MMSMACVHVGVRKKLGARRGLAASVTPHHTASRHSALHTAKRATAKVERLRVPTDKLYQQGAWSRKNNCLKLLCLKLFGRCACRQSCRHSKVWSALLVSLRRAR